MKGQLLNRLAKAAGFVSIKEHEKVARKLRAFEDHADRLVLIAKDAGAIVLEDNQSIANADGKAIVVHGDFVSIDRTMIRGGGIFIGPSSKYISINSVTIDCAQGAAITFQWGAK